MKFDGMLLKQFENDSDSHTYLYIAGMKDLVLVPLGLVSNKYRLIVKRL